MRRILSLLLVAYVTIPMQAVADPPCTCPDDFAKVVARVWPSVVNLSVIKIEAMAPSGAVTAARRLRFFGSGFVIDPKGIIVTNKHVIQGAAQITVSFSDGTRARGRLIAAAGETDLAVLRVDVGHQLAALNFTNSDDVRLGDKVLAIGNPYGLGTSVSHGIVSGLNRNLHETPFDDDIQTDAAINPGNSGGPLVDMRGKVVGIDTALYTQTNGGAIGIGYAIPSNDVAFAVNYLLDPQLPPPGWIGITGQDMTPDIVRAFRVPAGAGIIITAVDPDSPAQRAGLRPGDAILAFNGAAPSDTRALLRSIARVEAGRTITLSLWRNGAIVSMHMAAAPLPHERLLPSAIEANPALAEIAPSPDLGMGLAAINPVAQQQYDLLPGQKGALVVLVAPDTEASERGVQPGDVITSVDGTPVSSPGDVETLIEKATAEGRRYLAFLISGKQGLSWVTFYTGTDKSS
jgi:serine protease Do